MMYPNIFEIQFRNEAQASTMLAKKRGKQVKQLDRQISREQYVAKKASRVSTASTKHLEAQVTELKSKNKTLKITCDNERRKNKSAVLREYRGDIRRLRHTRHNLQQSVTVWDDK